MKSFLWLGLTMLSLSMVTESVEAQTIKAENINSVSTSSQLTPRELVFMAHRGRLTQQGIPSRSALKFASRSGKVSAAQLVEAAIAQNRLAPETSNDIQYLNAVENHLKNGGCGVIN